MSDEYSSYYSVGLGGGRNSLEARRFWEAVDEERLLIQRCRNCGETIFPPQDVCPYCWSDAVDWEESSGKGTVHTFSTTYVEIHPDWTGHTPYTIAFIELEEGVFVFSNLVDCEPEEIEIGMPVEVAFNVLPGADRPFPQFRPE